MANFRPVDLAAIDQYLAGDWEPYRPWTLNELPTLDHMLFVAMESPHYKWGLSFPCEERDDGLYVKHGQVLAVRHGVAVGLYQVDGQWHSVRIHPRDATRVAIHGIADTCIAAYEDTDTAAGAAEGFARYYLLDIDEHGELGARGQRAYRLRLGETDPRKVVPGLARDNAAIAAFRRNNDRQCMLAGCSQTTGLAMHHVWRLFVGGRDHEDNLVYLCGEHHAQVHYSQSTQDLTLDLIRSRTIGTEQMVDATSPMLDVCARRNQWRFLLAFLEPSELPRTPSGSKRPRRRSPR